MATKAGGKLGTYNLGELGVVITKSQVHGQAGELARSQNAVPDLEGGLVGIRKRQGMAALNSAAAAGAILALVNVPLTDADPPPAVLDFNVFNIEGFRLESYHVNGYPAPTGLTQVQGAPPADRHNWQDARALGDGYYYENNGVVYRTDAAPAAPSEDTMGTIAGGADVEMAGFSAAASYWYKIGPPDQVYKVLHDGGGVSAFGDAMAAGSNHNYNGIGQHAQTRNGKVFLAIAQDMGGGVFDFIVLSLAEGGSGAWTEDFRLAGGACSGLYANSTHVYATGLLSGASPAALGVYRSTGAGSWTQIFAPTPAVGYDFIEVIWASGDEVVAKIRSISGTLDEQLWYSANGGNSWTQALTGKKFFFVGDVTADEHLFVEYDPDLDTYAGHWLSSGTFSTLSVV